VLKIKHYAVKTYGGVDVQIHVFLISARLGRFTPHTHWIRVWVGLRTGLDNVEKKNKSLPYRDLSFNPSAVSP
jgi:hypothetical protein